jgi:Flp pilus assembly protein TadG
MTGFFKSCGGSLRRLADDTRGGVAMTFGLTAIPMIFLVGMTIDYSRSAQVKTQVNAAADAAALAAVAPAMMAEPDSVLQSTAASFFNTQVQGINGLNYDPNNLAVTVTSNGLRRSVTVNYSATVNTTFGGLLGESTVALNGTSTATSSGAPNIDFYLLLDTSPSMAIAATTDGINKMVANTKSQGGGCAFACHESNPKADNLGNPNGEDNYALARALTVPLRIDLVRTAVQNLTTTATQTQQTTNAQYRMAIYTFDVAFNTIALRSSNLSLVQSQAANIEMLEVYQNNWLTSSNNNSDTDTDYDNAMQNINQTMPNPGAGSNQAGDSPQEVLFLVTDGVEDETVNGKRQQSLMSTSWCTTIKSRGIRIAVLYTNYLPLPSNSWYKTYIAPFQAQIGPNLQSCASPGLFYEVTTDQDISAAMAAMFEQAVSTAYLSQ